MTDSNEAPKILIDWKKVFVDREEFLKLMGLVSIGLIGFLTAVPVVGFAFSYLFVTEPRKWIKIGAIDNFKIGETSYVVFEDPYNLPWDGVNARRATWLRRTGDNDFIAFALYCTHLGCPIRWKSNADLFFCPCHGGVFYSNGDVAGGPPPRPLHRYPVRLQDGQVEISVFPVLTQG